MVQAWGGTLNCLLQLRDRSGMRLEDGQRAAEQEALTQGAAVPAGPRPPHVDVPPHSQHSWEPDPAERPYWKADMLSQRCWCWEGSIFNRHGGLERGTGPGPQPVPTACLCPPAL